MATEDGGGGVGKAETTNKSNPKTVKPAHLYHAGNVACVYRLKLRHRHFSMKLKCTDGDVVDSGSSQSGWANTLRF